MFYVYVLKNQLSGKIYIGQTNNLDKRLKRHNGQLPAKKVSYTFKNKGFWRLVYKEEFLLRAEAIKREKALKSFRGRQSVRQIIMGP